MSKGYIVVDSNDSARDLVRSIQVFTTMDQAKEQQEIQWKQIEDLDGYYQDEINIEEIEIVDPVKPDRHFIVFFTIQRTNGAMAKGSAGVSGTYPNRKTITAQIADGQSDVEGLIIDNILEVSEEDQDMYLKDNK